MNEATLTTSDEYGNITVRKLLPHEYMRSGHIFDAYDEGKPQRHDALLKLYMTRHDRSHIKAAYEKIKQR